MKIQIDNQGPYIKVQKDKIIRPIAPSGYQHVFMNGTTFTEGDLVYTTHKSGSTRYAVRCSKLVRDSAVIEDNWFIDYGDKIPGYYGQRVDPLIEMLLEPGDSARNEEEFHSRHK